MRVLVACEFSGVVRNAFLERGHDAWSCDLDPGWAKPFDRHYRQDVRPLLRKSWDLVIAHPPCTYLCNSGVRWLATDPDRTRLMRKGANFFLECLNAAGRVCVENPVMHRYAAEIVNKPPTQIVQPWWFGDPESKATCLWLVGLPPLVKLVYEKPALVKQSVFKCPPGRNRNKIRSVFPTGLASQMAAQWG